MWRKKENNLKRKKRCFVSFKQQSGLNKKIKFNKYLDQALLSKT